MHAPALVDVTRAQLQQWEALDFIRWTALRIKHQQYESQALAEFRQRWPESPLRARLEFEAKAAISAGTTTDPTWGAPLIPAPTSSEGFAALIHAGTILGRLPDVRRVLRDVDPDALSALVDEHRMRWETQRAQLRWDLARQVSLTERKAAATVRRGGPRLVASAVLNEADDPIAERVRCRIACRR